MEKVKVKTIYILEPEPIPVSDISTLLERKTGEGKSDGLLYAEPVYLGKLFFKNGKKLKKPIDEKPERYELIRIKISENRKERIA